MKRMVVSFIFEGEVEDKEAVQLEIASIMDPLAPVFHSLFNDNKLTMVHSMVEDQEEFIESSEWSDEHVRNYLVMAHSEAD